MTGEGDLMWGSGKEAEQHTGCNCRTDHTGHIRAHGVHQQVVGRIVFQTEVVGDTGRHGHGRYAGIADERVDLLFLGEHEIEQLDEQYTAR